MPSRCHHTPSALTCQALATAELWTQEVLPQLPTDSEAQARSLGAFTRKRGLACASDLLRGLLVYVLLATSFQHLGALAVCCEFADISAASWCKRLVRARQWLRWLVSELLAIDPPAASIRLLPQCGGNILLIDATRLGQVGGTGDDWRLHTAFNLTSGRVVQVTTTDRSGGEHLSYYRIQPTDSIITDSGYGYRSSVACVRRQQAHLVSRVHPATFPFEQDAGGVLNVAAQLRKQGPNVREWSGWCSDADGERYGVRLLAAKLSDAQARAARKRVRRKATKDGRKVQEDTLLVAGWVLVVTSLPQASWSAEAVLKLYRMRWQIELVFKRFKQTLRVGLLRGRSAESVEASILAVLVAWLLAAQEAALVRARLRALGREDGWEMSSWAVSHLSMDVLRQQVRGTWGAARVQACLERLQRFVSTRQRHDRTNQEQQVREWLQRLPKRQLTSTFVHQEAFDA